MKKELFKTQVITKQMSAPLAKIAIQIKYFNILTNMSSEKKPPKNNTPHMKTAHKIAWLGSPKDLHKPTGKIVLSLDADLKPQQSNSRNH